MEKEGSHQLPAGTVLRKQYRIDRLLGQGGFGITYLGWDIYLDIPVAIKEYYPNGEVCRDCTKSTEVYPQGEKAEEHFLRNKERFLREARSLAKFSLCSEIVSVKNFFEENKTAYIVMEYVEGITLKQYVRERGGRLSFAEVFPLLRPILLALGRLHRAGVIHRDISPENIMILSGGDAKLVDFGAVRNVGQADKQHELTVPTEAIVKHGYAPMEQYLSRGQLGPWTDVYACCALLWFCLTGNMLPDAPERALGTEIDWDAPEASVPEDVKAVLRHGLELRVEARISDMTELYEALDGCARVEGSADAKVRTIEKEASATDKNAAEAVTEAEKEEALRKRTAAEAGTRAGRDEAPEKKAGAKKFRLLLAGAALLMAAAAGLCLLLLPGRTEVAQTEEETAQEETTRELVEGQCGDEAYYRFDPATGVLELYGSGDLWHVQYGVDPSVWDFSLEESMWEDYKEDIVSLVIGDEITAIRSAAFMDCVNLTEVDWGNIYSIDCWAFSNTGLTSVCFPDSLDEISENAFWGCQNLTEVVLPEELRRIAAGVFFNCPLTSVRIGPCTAVEDEEEMNAFCGNWNIPSELTIYGYAGSPAEEIANKHGIAFEGKELDPSVYSGTCGGSVCYAFDPDTGTLRISGSGSTYDYVNPMGNQVVSSEDNFVPENAPWFLFRLAIRRVVFEPGVVRAGNFAFRNLDNLEEIDFGEVRYLGHYAFMACGLTDVAVEDTVAVIGSGAFANCEELQSIVFCADEITVSGGALSYCPKLKSITVAGAVEFEEVDGRAAFFFDVWNEFTDGMPILYGREDSGLREKAEEYGCEFVTIR